MDQGGPIKEVMGGVAGRSNHADFVWIIRCGDCRRPDLSRSWEATADVEPPQGWSCEHCGGRSVLVSECCGPAGDESRPSLLTAQLPSVTKRGARKA